MHYNDNDNIESINQYILVSIPVIIIIEINIFDVGLTHSAQHYTCYQKIFNQSVHVKIHCHFNKYKYICVDIILG